MSLQAGVIGRPVAHSLSPLIHGAWLAAAGLDGEYRGYEPGGAFADLVADLRQKGLKGVNVTIPFKEEALFAADEASPRARGAGAANLLIFQGSGRTFADNTDGLGLLAGLSEQAPQWRADAGPAVILGAGGAARGAAFALRQAGAPRVILVNRTPERARTLAADLGEGVEAAAWDHAGPAFEQAALLVNATSLGLGGGDGPPIDMAVLPAGCVAMDMVYKPLRTGFLQAAQARGLIAVDGLAMLIGQARPSFHAFYGVPPPGHVDVRALALAALGEAAA